MFFLSLSTWDILGHLPDTKGTWDFYLNHVHQSVAWSLRLIQCALHNILLEHGGLPCVFPFTVHLDFGHLCDTQGYLWLLSEPCVPVTITQAHVPCVFPFAVHLNFGHLYDTQGTLGIISETCTITLSNRWYLIANREFLCTYRPQNVLYSFLDFY